MNGGNRGREEEGGRAVKRRGKSGNGREWDKGREGVRERRNRRFVWTIGGCLVRGRVPGTGGASEARGVRERASREQEQKDGATKVQISGKVRRNTGASVGITGKEPGVVGGNGRKRQGRQAHSAALLSTGRDREGAAAVPALPCSGVNMRADSGKEGRGRSRV